MKEAFMVETTTWMQMPAGRLLLHRSQSVYRWRWLAVLMCCLRNPPPVGPVFTTATVLDAT